MSFEADTETVRAALSDAEDPIMREERDDSEGWRPALDALYAMHVEHERLREGLRQYAAPRHWAIERFDRVHPQLIWIGPGADERPIPNGVRIARVLLDGTGTPT